MNIKIEKTPLKQGQVRIISSKSDGHRSLIAAALAEEESVLFVDGWSEDMEATARCLQSLGAEIEREPSGIYVMPIGCPLPCPVDRIGQANGQGIGQADGQLCTLDCGESGSTLRFLLPIAGALGKHCRFEGKGRLPERPIGVLLDEMARHGCKADGDHLPVTLEGKLTAGVYTLPGNVSSQFITGLLFALPLLPGNSTLTVQQPVESESYIRMTIEAIAASGIEVQESNAFSWWIPGHQQYKSHSCHLNGDYSQAAVLCCAGALGHDITVTHLSPVTTQGDRAILRHLMALGATVEESDNHIRVKADKLHGATLDMHDCPDIAPILALTAQFAEGESRLTHCGRLRLKECDRLAATVEILNLLGGNAQADGDDIVLHGVKQLRGGVTLPNYGDHRMVMLASIAATKCEQPIEMDGIEAIDKSWPEYLKVYQMLGGKCE